jgi:hypothetical protein
VPYYVEKTARIRVKQVEDPETNRLCRQFEEVVIVSRSYVPRLKIDLAQSFWFILLYAVDVVYASASALRCDPAWLCLIKA